MSATRNPIAMLAARAAIVAPHVLAAQLRVPAFVTPAPVDPCELRSLVKHVQLSTLEKPRLELDLVAARVEHLQRAPGAAALLSELLGAAHAGRLMRRADCTRVRRRQHCLKELCRQCDVGPGSVRAMAQPEDDQFTVPAQAIHSRNPRRSTPSELELFAVAGRS